MSDQEELFLSYSLSSLYIALFLCVSLPQVSHMVSFPVSQSSHHVSHLLLTSFILPSLSLLFLLISHSIPNPRSLFFFLFFLFLYYRSVLISYLTFSPVPLLSFLLSVFSLPCRSSPLFPPILSSKELTCYVDDPQH